MRRPTERGDATREQTINRTIDDTSASADSGRRDSAMLQIHADVSPCKTNDQTPAARDRAPRPGLITSSRINFTEEIAGGHSEPATLLVMPRPFAEPHRPPAAPPNEPSSLPWTKIQAANHNMNRLSA